MTIKQQGGIFGRNPTFNDLTVEGSVNIDGGAIDGVTLGVNSAITEAQIDNINIDGSTISTTAVVSSVEVNSGGTQKVYGGYTSGSGRPALYLESVGSNHDMVIKATDLVRFYDASNAENFIIDHLNNKLVSNYNLAFGSGNGIDFSATAGTGTSELFDDYEEGTWTPVVAETSSGGTVATGTFTGTYTKIGRMVTVNLTLTDITTSGMTAGNIMYIRGLPFTTGTGHIGSNMMRSVTYSGQIVPRTLDGQSYFYFYQYATGGTVTPLTIGGISSGVSDIWATVTYEV